MGFKILVVGLLPSDSGKTTLATGIAAGLSSLGYRVVPFKPISAHNWYTQYSATLANLDRGIPLSEDIIKLAEASGASERMEALNPVDILTAPLNPGGFLDARAPSSFYSYMGDFFRQALISRISFVRSDGSIVSVGYRNKGIIEKNLVVYRREILERVTRRLSRVEDFTSVKALAEVLARNSMPAVDSALRYLDRRHRIILIESFNDAAWPLPAGAAVDMVIAVSPGLALIYDPARYRMAVQLREHAMPSFRSAVLSDVFDLVNPLMRLEVPPVPYGTVPESIAEKIDELVGLVSRAIEEAVKQ